MITKSQFEEAYKKYPPCKIEIFYFKHFSVNTLKKFKWVTWLVVGILFIPFLLGFIFTVLNEPIGVIRIPTMIYTGLIIIFAIPWIAVWVMHLLRIRKIRKYLHLTRKEYDDFIGRYYFSNVPTPSDLVEYIKSKMKPE